MLSIKRQKVKKALIIIITTILVLSILSFITTKVIYDSIFKRYNCNVSDIPQELSEVVSQREEYKFYSNNNLLCGYLNRAKSSNKDTLIVIAPGQNACADSYLWQTKELLELGWSIFTFNATGCCSSEGKSSIGFSQELFDLNSALDFLKTRDNFGFKNIVLLGHSRGGFAVSCAIKDHKNVKAIISISGANSAMDATIGTATKYVGPLAYGNFGCLWLYQSLLFSPETVNLKADNIIEKSKVPALIVHGANDDTVPLEKFSILSCIDENSSNAKSLIIDNKNNSGHTNLLFDNDGTANNYLIAQINCFLTDIIY